MKRFFFIMLLLMTLGINSQSLEECRRLACEHYPEIRQYDLISLTEEYNVSNAARAWIPQVTLSGQATYQTATPTYPDALNTILQANGVEMVGIEKDQYRIALDVSQHIWDGGQSKANRLIAEAEAAEQRTRIEVSLHDLQSRVDNIYFGILLLDERVAQTKAQISILESNLARMRSYHSNGVAMQSDVDAVEAELLVSKQTLAQIESSRTNYRRMLEAFIGQSLTDEKLQRPKVTDVIDRTSARPELKLFNAQESVVEAQRKAINSSSMPRFNAFAQAYYGYPGLDMFQSMVDAKWSPNAVVGLRMSWNIASLYTKKNQIEKLNIAQQRIAVQRDVFLFNTDIQIMQDDSEIARLKKALEDDARIVELRRSVRVAAESKLENGVIDATDLLRKITDETTATLNYSMHEIELLQAIYNLKHLLNQ